MRVFVAIKTDLDEVLTVLEREGYQVLYLSGDSVQDNLESLLSCQLVIADDSSPSWVLREVSEHKMLLVSYRSGVSLDSVCLIHDLHQLCVACSILSPHAANLAPVDERLARDLAALKLMYPTHKSKEVA